MTLFDCFTSEEVPGAASSVSSENSTNTTSPVNEDCRPVAKYMDTSNWFDNLTDEDFSSMDAILAESDPI